MMLAELSGLETGGLICAMIFSGIGTLVGVIALFKKSAMEISPQPLSVEIVEELHQQFAAKDDFNKHVEKTDGELKELREILRTEIPDMVKEVNKAGEQRIRRVHSRLDPLVVGVAQLCAKQGIRMPQPQTNNEE